MPELPEVETIKRGLEKYLLGKRVLDLKLFRPKSFLGSPEELIGHQIEGLARRGKLLIFNLDSGFRLHIHLRLTGQLIFQNQRGERDGGGHPSKEMLMELPNSATRIAVKFENGTLFFNDLRKFGYFQLLRPEEEDPFLAKLGPEPFDPSLNPEWIAETLSRRSRANIKALLLDQHFIAGLGNIYADETLFLSKLDPRLRCGEIPPSKAPEILENIRTVLRRGIEFGGVSFSDYVNAEGFKGKMQEQLYVYGRTGQPCKVCSTPIEKIKVAGRGTHFCPNCQALPLS